MAATTAWTACAVGAAALLAGEVAAGADDAGFAPRSLDFQGGFFVAQPARGGWHALPSPLLEVRAYSPRGLWASGGAGAELCVDLDDPERGRLVSLYGGSLAAGAWTDAWPRLTLLAGARVDWVIGAAELGGPRAGATLSAAWMLGRTFGHPVGLEARASYLFRRASGAERAGALHAALLLTGVLLPDRPLGR
jgi:hypothetical protein